MQSRNDMSRIDRWIIEALKSSEVIVLDFKTQHGTEFRIAVKGRKTAHDIAIAVQENWQHTPERIKPEDCRDMLLEELK